MRQPAASREETRPIVRDWLDVRAAAAGHGESAADLAQVWRGHASSEQVFEVLPTGLIMVGDDGVICVVNAEAERIFGYARADLIGAPVEKIAIETVLRRPSDAQAPAAAHASEEVLGCRQGGERVPVEVTAIPIRGSGALLVVNDISERRRAESALKAKSEELERSNADLEQFAYVASHDLQEPLRMVASYTQLLADKYQGRLDGDADRYIGYAVDGAKRMQVLVRDLLSYSRVTAAPTPFEEVDANVLVADLLKVMEATVAATGAVVRVETLPSVFGDASQLRHVFLNGIANALKFRREDAPRVRIGATTDGGMVRFCIEDNGIGLDPRHSARIFQMFQRLHERGKYEGSGIGLAIVKKIVERHGGRVWMESELGNGARLNFTLPRAACR